MKNVTIKKMVEVRDFCERRLQVLDDAIDAMQSEKKALVEWCAQTEDAANALGRVLEEEIPIPE